MSPKIEQVGVEIIKAKAGVSTEFETNLFDNMTPDDIATITSFVLVCQNICKDFLYGVYFGYTLAKESSELEQLEKMMKEGN